MIIKSLCNVTGLPVALAIGFEGVKVLNQFKGEVQHPIFNYPMRALAKAAPAVLQDGAPDEHKLLFAAFAVKLDLWEVRAPMTIDSADCARLLDYLLDLVPEIIRSPQVKTHKDHVTNKRFPKLSVDGNTSKGQFASHLKVVADCLSGKVVYTQQDKLDWELELEAELNRTLRSGNGYNARIGKWAIQWAKDAEIRNKITELDYLCFEYCVNTLADYLKESQLAAAIDVALKILPCDDELQRQDSLLLIRYLEKKQEVLVKEKADFDLVDLEEVDGKATQAGATYKVIAGKDKAEPTTVIITAEHKAAAKVALQKAGNNNPSPIQLMLEARKIASN